MWSPQHNVAIPNTSKRFHFMNSVRDFSNTYSCAIDCFLEIWIACISNLQLVHNNNFNIFFERMSWVVNHYSAVKNDFVTGNKSFYESTRQLVRIREHIWGYIRGKCPSHVLMNCDAQFSEIFRLPVFGDFTPEVNETLVRTPELNEIFLSTFTSHAECRNCLQRVVKSSEVFVHYLTSNMLSQQTNWENLLVENNYYDSFPCENCIDGHCVVSDFIVSGPSTLFIEFSSGISIQSLKQQIILGNDTYKLCGMVKNLNLHFSCAVSRGEYWEFIDDLKEETNKFESLFDLFNVSPQGWFF